MQNPRATYRAAIQHGMNACLRQITLQRSTRFTQDIVGLEIHTFGLKASTEKAKQPSWNKTNDNEMTLCNHKETP